MTMKLKKEEKEYLILKLQGYFFDERAEELGTIGAENLVRFFMEECSPVIYNHAIEDAKRQLQVQTEAMEEAMDVLKK
jgi:uncharacterized protein (DUF2164 family)